MTAEVNRDGIFEVTLLQDPYEEVKDGDNVPYYILQYLSDGKRGKKIVWNKIGITSNNLLYVLTVQCKQQQQPNDDNDDDSNDTTKQLKEEMKRIVDSFRILSSTS